MTGERFKLIRFSPRRSLRGAPAAQVQTTNGLLWMSRDDIRKNIRDWGDHPELWKAYEAYDKCEPYPDAKALDERQQEAELESRMMHGE